MEENCSHSNSSLHSGYTVGDLGFEEDLSEKFYRKVFKKDPKPSKNDPANSTGNIFPGWDLDLLEFFFHDNLVGRASSMFT